MKFIHFADSHLDGFRDKRLSLLGLSSFKYVFDQAIKERVDFVLLAGDLFNTAIPRVDTLKFATLQLKRLKEANIPLYVIGGSHDFSSQGKSMLDVLEITGLLINVMNGQVNKNNGKLILDWVIDKKTGVLISGIMGKRGMLDKKQYQDLDNSLLHQKNGFKIFMFHTALEELKTPELERMEGFPISMLPTGCDYYAGGHVHVVKRYSDDNYKNIVYPGPTFPNNFSELEKLRQGTYVYYDSEQTNLFSHKKIPTKEILSIHLNATGKSSKEIFDNLVLQLNDCDDMIVLLRVSGTLAQGSIQDCNFEELIRTAYQNGAFVVLKNTSKLSSKSFEEIIDINCDQDNIELETITQHVGQIKFEGEEDLKIREILEKLYLTQVDGEKKSTFTDRVIEVAKSVLEK